MKIAVDIKTKCGGKFCSWRCYFLDRMIFQDQCELFGMLERVNKMDWISLRHPECLKEEIK